MAVSAALSAARGKKADQDGDYTAAETHLRQAIATYLRTPENPAMLNNCALAYFTLARVARDSEAYQQGTQMMAKAVALNPSESLVIGNAAALILQGALTDIVGTAIDLNALRIGGSIELLAHLYADETERDVIVQQVKAYPGIATARAYLEQLLVLSPKSITPYVTLTGLFRTIDDNEALAQLGARSQTADLDLTDANQHMLDHYAGTNDAKLGLEYKTARQRLRRALAELSATIALQNHWRYLIEGNTSEAERLLKTYRDRGVPLP